ncbi:probable WRKY transcription factor 3 [Telopea speciosissima]|uniref:probable WRKY transcription factor 3 n=1 Tax=Telopea speciosissima TaxID=54955 RepID=UPI001CC474CC|nr:probable WRKY transcription factor 3 [Telopea speciosissima]
MAENEGVSRATAPRRPTIALPPRSSVENLFIGGAGASPGPLTLVSNFFSDNDPESDVRSFSQLLAGAMASPATVTGLRPSYTTEVSSKERDSGDGAERESRLKQSRPLSLLIAPSPMFTVPPGLSPATLLDSPGYFSPGQGAFGISHQLALAHVTAQAAQSQAQMHRQVEYPSSLSAPPASLASQHPSFPSNATAHEHATLSSDPKSAIREPSEMSHSDHRSQPITADKPADDGYNWRKYGQKQVKGSEYPRSYYKCTHLNCPVKKKVERSLDGQVTEIIYKGQHNHQPPQSNKRGKESGNPHGNSHYQGNPEVGSQFHFGDLSRSSDTLPASSLSRRDQESSQATHEHLSGSSDGEEMGDSETRADEGDDDEPDPKRRHTEVRVSELPSSHKTVTEPRIIVQTTSEVDLLDDGYRWRKYGQKVVKGNPHPRSYYKCTNAGCNVRKHVERASGDPKAVITMYEGKHNHDVPAAKNSSHNTANSNMPQFRPQAVMAEKHPLFRTDLGNNVQQPIALLRFKEEQIT